MILADFLPPKRDRSWDFARQVGVTHAIARCHPRDTGLNPPWEIDALRTVQRNFAASGIKLIGLEGDEFDMRRIKLGLAGRDEDLELYCCLLANMGELGIRLLCYNFMATIGWCRTDTRVPARGDAITNRFQLSALDAAPVPPEDRVTAVKDLREVTKQTEGLNPGNFAVAQEDGRAHQVLLIAQSGDKWVTRRFAGRVGIFESKDLKPIPLKPALKVGQAVQAPWVGMMYPGKVKKITGTRVEVAVDGIATKEPVVTSLGQVLPEPAGAKADAKKDEAKPAVKGKPAK